MSEAGNVTRLEHAGREIHLIGTAHISRRSVEEVERVISELRPNTVCVELDSMRYEALVDDDRWRKLDLFAIIREKKVLYLLSSLALSAYQKKLGDRVGVRPGAELLAAVKAAKQVGAELVLADRDIQATLKRAWRNLSFLNKVQLSTGLAAAPFAMEELDEARVEQLKDRDTLSEMIEELSRAMPGLKAPLIDERDAYLMSVIQEAPGPRIVAVVGAGHVPGMVRRLGQSVDREALSAIPPPSVLTRVMGWLIPAIVLGAFAYGYSEHSTESLKHLVLAWVLPTSLSAALFGVLSAAKPLTILTALVAAPLTTLNPTIGAGMVCGLVEAWLRRPTVADCQRVPDDILSLRGIYRNPFTRVLWVALLTTVGAALGAAIGAGWVVSLL